MTFLRGKKLKSILSLVQGGYDKSAKDQADWLRKKGYSEEVIELTNSVAVTSLPRFRQDYGSVTLPEKIIHYIDDITKDSELVQLDERMDAVELNPKYAEFNEEGRKRFDGLTAFEAQREMSKRIEREFAEVLNLVDPTILPFLIRATIDERIATQA